MTARVRIGYLSMCNDSLWYERKARMQPAIGQACNISDSTTPRTFMRGNAMVSVWFARACT